MKKILLIGAILAGLLVGCGNTTTSNTQPSQPTQPVQPPENTIPTAGKGSIKGDLDCTGGVITTNYSFGNVEEDDKNFVIEYQRNGDTVDLTYPSASTTGSRTIVKDVYYVGANDSKNKVHWIVTIAYQTAGETYDLVTTTISQPVCDDNATALTTTYEVK